jgi:hypothetical protein
MLGPSERANFHHWTLCTSSHERMETDPVSETFVFSSYLESRTMDKVYKGSDSERYIQSSTPFRI